MDPMTADLPHVLILDDGELSDVRSVLEDLEIPYVESESELPTGTSTTIGLIPTTISISSMPTMVAQRSPSMVARRGRVL